MEIRVLRNFLEVVKEGNITRAAEKLCIAQPPLSRQMRLLEEELQVKLFIRGKRQITLTEEGRFLKQQAEEIIYLMEKTERQLGKMSALVNGLVSIGTTEVCGASILSDVLESFHKAYPGIRFQIWSGTGDEIRNRLETNLVDLGIVREPFHLEHYDRLYLRSEPWIAVCGKDYPELGCSDEDLPLDALNQVPLLLPMRETLQQDIISWFSEGFAQRNVLCHYGSLTSVIGLIERNLGVAICPESVQAFTSREKLVHRKIVRPEHVSRVFLVKKRAQIMPVAAEMLWEFMRTYVESRIGETADGGI